VGSISGRHHAISLCERFSRIPGRRQDCALFNSSVLRQDVCVRVNVLVNICLYMCVCVCVYVYICVCACVCVFWQAFTLGPSSLPHQKSVRVAACAAAPSLRTAKVSLHVSREGHPESKKNCDSKATEPEKERDKRIQTQKKWSDECAKTASCIYSIESWEKFKNLNLHTAHTTTHETAST